MSAPILSIEHEDVELASPLSDFLLRRWDYVESEGALRTNVKETLRRVLPGDFGLVVQFNPSHLKSKRPVDKQLLKGTAEASSAQTASPAFNFTKAKKCEFLSGLNFVDGGETCLPTVEIVEMKMEVETQHFVLVNVVPLVRGHFLFVPDINEVKPQIMEKAYLKYGLSISRAIQREDFALGFNSTGAWSSVNHFHLQGYVFPQTEDNTAGDLTGRTFPVATQSRKEVFRLGGVAVKNLPSWKTTCFVIESEDPNCSAHHVADVAWSLLEILQTREVAHNVLVVGAVVFIFPRLQQCENGRVLSDDTTGTEVVGSPTVCIGRLRIAVAELSGLIIAGDTVAYEKLTEEIFTRILQNEVSLSDDEAAAIMSEWKANLGL